MNAALLIYLTDFFFLGLNFVVAAFYQCKVGQIT